MSDQTPIRVVLAKIGLDGHDRGVKVVARGLRDAGFQVIYAGLWQSPSAVTRAVADEDADWVGLSLLSGAHMTLVPQVIESLRNARLNEVGVVVGGIIPDEHVPKLADLGVARVFGPGTPISEIATFLTPRTSRELSPSLLDRFRNGDRLALSHLLSLADSRTRADGFEQELDQGATGSTARAASEAGRSSRVVAITGSGGVGKSTLIGKLVTHLRSQSRTVAVLACDPQSPITHGTLFGDRVRMPTRAEDDGVFIRSVAVPSGQQALAPNVPFMTRLLVRYGFDTVIVETAGAGQADTRVREIADVVALLVQPESGDELQWQKAGVLEIADVVVVHKADLPGAENTEAQLRDILQLGSGRVPVVVRASANRGQGIDEVWNAIERVERSQ